MGTWPATATALLSLGEVLFVAMQPAGSPATKMPDTVIGQKSRLLIVGQVIDFTQDEPLEKPPAVYEILSFRRRRVTRMSYRSVGFLIPIWGSVEIFSTPRAEQEAPAFSVA